MPYLAGHYVGDPFSFCRGDQAQHRPSDSHRFWHINSPHALRGLKWTLPECIQHVTEKGRFEARYEHESYILVRETLSFSKKLIDHIGAIKYFICHYNLTTVAA
jgi:hypothetical protein